MKKTVLIIDDDPYFVEMLSEMLEKEDFQVFTAPDGIQGTALFKDNAGQIDLVLTDIIMPDKEGIETIIDLKKTHPDVKIIAMSGGGRIGPQTYLQCAKELGADHAIEKPFSRKTLLDTISRLLSP